MRTSANSVFAIRFAHSHTNGTSSTRRTLSALHGQGKEIIIMRLRILFLLFFTLGYVGISSGYEAPPGIEQKPIRGNFRVIEHDASKIYWIVCDTQGYKETKEGYILYPPTYCYMYFTEPEKKWDYENYHKPIETIYVKELTTIIPRGSEKKKVSTKPTLSLDQTLKKFIVPVSTVKKTKEIEGNMVIIMGERDKVAPLWLFKNGQLYCINGAAKGLTKTLSYTFDITPEKAYELLK